MLIIEKIKDFFDRGIWTTGYADLPLWKRALYCVLQRVYLTIKCFVQAKLSAAAAALTYSTMLSIVPVLTIVFAISRGFGYNVLVEQEMQTQFSGQTMMVNTLLEFVNSYLSHTKNGFFIGFGLVLMFGTLISLVSGIERSFNSIWQIKNMRSTARMIVDYSAIMLLLPTFLIVSIGINIYINTQLDSLESISIIKPMAKIGITLLPFVLMTCLFTSLYLFLPNTRVKFRGAIIAGIMAGGLFQLIQYLYIHSQMWMTSYNAIYGSFAAIPLFMLLCQISWNVCLFCAQFSYIDQNIDNFYYGKESLRVSHRVKIYTALVVMSDICKRFVNGGLRSTAEEIASHNKLPIRLINDILFALIKAKLIAEVISGSEDRTSSKYIPAKETSTISIGRVVAAMERVGDESIVNELDNELTTRWQRISKLSERVMETDELAKNITLF